MALASEVATGTLVQLVPLLVEYCHAPSVLGLAAVPVITTPIMVSAPLGSPVSLGSVKRGVNRLATVSPPALRLPSAVAATTTSTVSSIATGRSLTGTTTTLSVPVVVAAAAVPSALVAVTVSVAAGVVPAGPVEFLSVGAVMVALTSCAVVSVAAPAVCGITLPAPSLMTQPTGMALMVTVVPVVSVLPAVPVLVSAVATDMPKGMGWSSRPLIEPVTVAVALLPVAAAGGLVSCPVVVGAGASSPAGVPIVRRGASDTGVTTIPTWVVSDTRPVANWAAFPTGLVISTTAPATKASIEFPIVVPLAAPLVTSAMMLPVGVCSLSTKRTLSLPGVPE